MDVGQILYIIAIVAYFIYQATKKKARPGEAEPESGDAPQPQKGISFEELLKEIRNAQNPPASEMPRPPKPEPARPTPIPPNFPEAKKQRKRAYEPVEELDDEAKYYDGAFGAKKASALSAAGISIPNLSEKKIDYDALSKKKVNPYAEKLKNPQSVKEAMVLAEILKPKHF